MSEQTVTMRYRMSSRDEFYGGGVVTAHVPLHIWEILQTA